MIAPPPLISRSSRMLKLKQIIDPSGNTIGTIGTLMFDISPDKKESYFNRGIATMPQVLKNGKYAWDCSQLADDQKSNGATWAYIDVRYMSQEDLTKYAQARIDGKIEDYYNGQPWAWVGSRSGDCYLL